MLRDDEAYGINVAELTVLKYVDVCTVPLLTTFYEVELYINLTEVHIMANKRKLFDIASGVLDYNTIGLFLLALAFNARTMPIIGTVPPMVPRPLPRHYI